jgi:hypothetical protein
MDRQTAGDGRISALFSEPWPKLDLQNSIWEATN